MSVVSYGPTPHSWSTFCQSIPTLLRVRLDNRWSGYIVCHHCVEKWYFQLYKLSMFVPFFFVFQRLHGRVPQTTTVNIFVICFLTCDTKPVCTIRALLTVALRSDWHVTFCHMQHSTEWRFTTRWRCFISN
jgi:hypothetical protein